MTDRHALSVLQTEIARFEAEVHELAWRLVRSVVAQELARRAAAAPPAPRRGKRAAPPAPVRTPRRRARPAPVEAATTEATGADATAGAASATGEPTAGEPTAAPPPAEATPPKPPGKGRWTRDAIIDELARWLVSGTVVDAAFLSRNGPPGLVAAARRVFGRFEAALNVAGLHAARVYPDGTPPSTDDVVA